MNFFGSKDPAGQTLYPEKSNSLINSGMRDLSPPAQRDKKPFFV